MPAAEQHLLLQMGVVREGWMDLYLKDGCGETEKEGRGAEDTGLCVRSVPMSFTFFQNQAGFPTQCGKRNRTEVQQGC